MFIKKIELENIKIYDKRTIEFTSGVNFISGKNGAGKTTLIECIGFALFNAKAGGANFSSYLVRKGTKKGKIRLTFLDKDNNELISERSIYTTGTGNTWAIKRITDGEETVVISGIKEVPAYLKDILGFDYDDDMSQVYEKILSVPQGKMTAVFFESPEARKAEFDPLFKLDSFRKANEKIKLGRSFDEDNIKLGNDIANMNGQISKYDEVELEIKNKKEELKEKNIKLKEFSDNSENIKKEYEEIEKVKKQITEKENEIKLKEQEQKSALSLKEKYDKDLEEIKKSIKILNDNEEGYNEYVKKEQELTKLEESFKELETIKEDYDKQKSRIENGNVQVEAKEKELSNLLKEIEIKKNKSEELNKKILELKDKYNKLGKDTADTKVDLSKLKQDYEKILELSFKIDNIDKELKKSLLKNDNKEILYLNTANKNLDKILELSDGEINNYAKNAKDNLMRAIEINKESNGSSDSNDLIEEKDSYLNEIDKLFKLNVKDDSLIEKYNDDFKKAKDLFNEYLSNEEKKNKPDEESIRLDSDIKNFIINYNELIKEISDTETKIKDGNAEKEKWIQGIKTITDKVNSMQDKVKEYDLFKTNIEQVKKDKNELKSNYDLYNQNIKKKDELHNTENSIKEIDEKIKTMTDNLSLIKNDYDKLISSFDEEDYNKKKSNYDDYKVNYNLLKQEIDQIDNLIKKDENTLKEYDDIKVKVVELNKEREDNEDASKLVKSLKQVISEAPEHIADMLIKDISHTASEYYSEISSDSNKLEWESSYELFLNDYIDEKEIKKEFKQLSGGEQMSAALSVHIAMLLKLSKLKIGVLDEPTTNIDTARREKIAEIISRTSEKFDQLFVVSHDDTFENITQNVISLTGGKE